jgi:parallel beta-helix repeat protein
MKWLLIFSLIFALLGCTGGPKNQAKLEVSAAFLNANLNAGLMLYIINKDKNTQRSIKLTGNTITVQLEDGNWDFAVLAWSGSSPMSGNLQCAKASRTFKNSNEEIRLTLGVSDCDSDFFAPAVYRSLNDTTTPIKKLDLVNCTSTSSITSAGSPCSKGPALSYKVKLLGHPDRPISSLPNIIAQNAAKLETDCLPLNDTDPKTSTNLTIPFGSQAFHPPTIIETFTDTICKSGQQTLFFPDGLAHVETSDHNAKSFAGTSTGVVFISPSEIATGVVSPFYTGSTSLFVDYWNIYASDSKPYQTSTSGECDPGNDSICQHRGDKRVTVLPNDFTSCGNLVGKDILMVFRWECYEENSNVKFRIKEFNAGKGLKDLIDPTNSTWKQIQFKAYNGSTLVYQTALTTWWSNPIQNIDGLDGYSYEAMTLPTVNKVFNLDSSGSIISSTGALHSFDLGYAGTVYVHSTDLDVPSIHIGGKNVSLVSLDSKKIKSNNSSNSTCSSSTGGVASADKNALICVGGTAGQNHAWIEVNAEGKSNLADLTLFMKTPAFARVHNSKLTKGGTALTIYDATKPNFITKTETSDNKVNGVLLYSSSSVVLDSLRSFKNEANGLELYDSKENRIFGSTFSFNAKRGAYFNANTLKNIFHDSVIANNCRAGGSSGFGAVEFTDAKSNTLYNLLVTGNDCHALRISGIQTYLLYNTFLNLTLTNNANGIYLDNAFYNTFVNVIASNTTLNNNSYTNGAGLFLSYSNYNNFTNFVTTNNNTGVDFQNSNSNTFTNAFLTGNNYQVSTSQDCIIDVISSNNTLTNSTGQNDCSSAITKPGKNLVNAFVGKVDSDEKNQDNTAYKANTHSYLGESSILDFINFYY